MITTIEIPDDTMKRALMLTGMKTPQEALLKLLEQLVTRDQASLVPLLGTFRDDFMTDDELKQIRGG